MPGEYTTEALQAHFAGISKRFDHIESELERIGMQLGVGYNRFAADVPSEVVELARAGKTMEAVKKYRELTNATFDHAREVIAGL